MKKIYKISCAVLACGLGVGMIGCSKQKDDAIKLTVWVSETEKAFVQQAIDAFKQKNPDKNYKITIDMQGVNDVATRVLKDVENAADIYSCSNDQLSQLVNGDALAQISGERLSRLQQANAEEAVQSVTLKKGDKQGVYGLPYTDNTFFLYYNKSVLTETDVQSVDGILSKCTNGKQFAFPMRDGWYTTSFYFGKDLGYQVEYDDNLGESKITCDFDNDTGIAVTQSIWDLVKDNRVKADADDSKIIAGFNDGSIVAAVSGIWNKTTIEGYLKGDFAAAKLPTYTFKKGTPEAEQVQLTAFAGYKLYGVNNYSKNKTDALDFAEFLTNTENQVKYFEMRGYVPTDKTARQNEKVQADVCAKAITAQLAYSKTQMGVPSTLWRPMEGLGAAMITGINSGNFNAAEQIKACVAAIEKNADK